MPIDTSSTALGSSANANADVCGGYSATVTGDTGIGTTVTSDCANGKAIVDNAYTTTNGDINKMTASCAAIYGGFCTAFDPNASVGTKAEGLLEIEAGVAGVCLIVSEVTAAGVSVALIDATTGATIAAAVPVVGWVCAVAIAAAAVIVAVFDAIVPVASGKPIPWTDQDSALLVIGRMLEKMPSTALPGAPFTDASRQLASLGAAYVQAKLAETGDGRTAARSSDPGKGFGYQTSGTGATELSIAALLGGDHGKANAFLSILSVLWDPRWRGTYTDEFAGNAGQNGALGIAMELDPSNPQNILGGTIDIVTTRVTPVSDETGLPAASYLCEVAAAAFLANLNNPAGRTYAAVYLRLCQTAWFYKACEDADGHNVIDVPPSLTSAIGFMLDSAVQNGASTRIAPQSAVAVKPSSTFGVFKLGGPHDLNFWVSYYLNFKG